MIYTQQKHQEEKQEITQNIRTAATFGWREEIRFEMNPWGTRKGLATFYVLTKVVTRMFTFHYSLYYTSLLYPHGYFTISNKRREMCFCPTPSNADSSGLGWGLGMSISNMPPNTHTPPQEILIPKILRPYQGLRHLRSTCQGKKARKPAPSWPAPPPQQAGPSLVFRGE